MFKREEAASIKIRNGTKWWVTGGSSVGSFIGVYKTTEILSLDNLTNFEYGPDLPERSVGHCIARINDTHLFFTSGDSSSNTYIFDEYSYNYTTLPPLNLQRNNAACAVIRHLNETALMVIGGTCSHQYCPWEKEILQINDEGHPYGNWVVSSSKNLTGGWSNGGYVTDYDGNKIILVGSQYHFSNNVPDGDLSDKFIRFLDDDNSFEFLAATLEYGRSGSTAISIPIGSIDCNRVKNINGS